MHSHKVSQVKFAVGLSNKERPSLFKAGHMLVMETAGEGGAWGIALLAAYMKNRSEGESLGAYLAEKVFAVGLSNKERPSLFKAGHMLT